MLRRRALLLLLCVAPLMVLPALHASCPPGTYIYNSSGQFICLPPVKPQSIGFASFSALLNSSGLRVVVDCVAGPCQVVVNVTTPSGQLLATKSENLDSGQTMVLWVPVSGYSYLVVSMSINGYQVGPYAVPAVLSPSVDVSKLDPRVAIVFLVAIVAPLIGVALRGNPKEAGIGIIALTTVWIPIAHKLGLPAPYPEIAAAIAYTAGIVMIATSRG